MKRFLALLLAIAALPSAFAQPAPTPDAYSIGITSSGSLILPASVTAVASPAGVKWTFTPSSTYAGFNPGTLAGNPSTLSAGDLWWNSSTGTLNLYTGSSTLQLSNTLANPMTTTGDIIIGGSSGTPTRLGAGTSGYVLTIVSGAPAWAASSGGFSNPMTTAGDMIIGGTSGTPTRLASGTNGYVLEMVSGVPAWTAASGGGNVSSSGTPASGQVAMWVSASAIQGTNSPTISGTLTLSALTTAGILTNNSSGTVASLSNASSVNSTLMGLLGSSWSNSTSLFLRADGTWNTPSGSGGGISGATTGQALIATGATTATSYAGLTETAAGAVTLNGSITGSAVGLLNIAGAWTAVGANQTYYGLNEQGTTINTGTYTGQTVYMAYFTTPTLAGSGSVTGGSMVYIGAPLSGQAYALQIASGANTLGSGTTSAGTLTLTNALGVAYGGTGSTTVLAAWASLTPAAYSGGSTTSSTTLTWGNGPIQKYTLGANTTFTFSGATSGETVVFELLNTASNYTVTWPSIKWTGGTAPTMTTGAHYDVYTVFYDGTNYFGSYVQNF